MWIRSLSNFPLSCCLLTLISPCAVGQLAGKGSYAAGGLIRAAISQLEASNVNFSARYEGSFTILGLHDLVSSNRTIDFVVAEETLPPEEYKTDSKSELAYVPFAISTLAVTANLAGNGYRSLNFDYDTLARIYTCNLTRWNDDALQALNPRYNLPNAAIVVLARSDTYANTRQLEGYLEQSELWPLTQKGGLGDGPWPFPCIKYAKGVIGMSNALRTTPFSLGYGNQQQAANNSLAVAALLNLANRYITPLEANFDGLRNDLKLPDRAASPLWSNVRLVQSRLPTAYPISSLTYVVVRQMDLKDGVKGRQLTQLLDFVQSSAMDPIALSNEFKNLPNEIKQVNYTTPVDPSILAAINGSDLAVSSLAPAASMAAPQGEPAPEEIHTASLLESPVGNMAEGAPAPGPDAADEYLPPARQFPTWKLATICVAAAVGAALLIAAACCARFLYWRSRLEKEYDAEQAKLEAGQHVEAPGLDVKAGAPPGGPDKH